MLGLLGHDELRFLPIRREHDAQVLLLLLDELRAEDHATLAHHGLLLLPHIVVGLTLSRLPHNLARILLVLILDKWALAT